VLSYACERDLVVIPAGGFTHQETGRTPHHVDILLRMERFNSIEHYDPGDLTIGVGAGATIGEIEAMLRDQGQLIPVDIAHSDRVTIGGAMAVAAHGPLKHMCGGLREYCLGVRYVTADGKIAKAGARVVKNVAGFDVMKLLIGSYGTLAVITSASFKLFPTPAGTKTYVCQFATLPEAIACRDFVVNSPLTPMCIEVFSPRAYKEDSWTIAVRAGGSERVLARYARDLGTSVTTALDGFEEQKFWVDAQQLGQQSPVTLSVSIPPASAGEVLAAAERAAIEQHLSVTAWGRIATSSLLFALDGGMTEGYVAAVKAIRQSVPGDGSAVVTRCPVALKEEMDVWGTSPAHLDSMANARRALNPKNNLNRGRFLF
jgi:glycolate oxidase FAD binding subunit